MPEIRRRIAYKLFGGHTSDQALIKRFKIFVIVAMALMAVSKLLYLQGVMPFPNFELIMPALVVVGSFSFYFGGQNNWKRLVKYFGILALISVYVVDVAFWGFRSIFVFTWSGFLIVWLIAIRNKLSMFDRFRKLLYKTTFTAIVAILVFDVWTAFGTWLGDYPKTIVGLATCFLAQIPFTIYHLTSVVFVPPLVGLGKMMARVRVAAPVAASVRADVKTRTKYKG